MTRDYSSAVLLTELEQLAERARAFMAKSRGVADDVELWLCGTLQHGFMFHDHRLIPMRTIRSERAGLRVLARGRMGRAGVSSFDMGDWTTALDGAMAKLGPEGPVNGFTRPTMRRPAPFTFDADLADALADEAMMKHLAFALCDNAHHEAARTPGLERLSGGVVYTVQTRVVATSKGTVFALHGDLDARLRFNGMYSELFHQVHLPDSFLPLAMLGARAWLNMPSARVQLPRHITGRQVPVLLHPRLMELLLRRVGEPMLSTTATECGASPLLPGAMVADRNITLADDSTLDGLATSRAFDDEGTPTRRIPVILKGRLTQTLVTYQEAAARGVTPTGNGYRRSQGGQGVEHVEVSPRLGCLVMDPGTLGLNEMLSTVPEGLLVYEVAGFDLIDPKTSKFQAIIASAVTLGANGGMIPPGRHRITGHLFRVPGISEGVLSTCQLSRELYDTGGAILPYCLTMMEVS
ncbi:MAG: metallopeptidase TldD-related protein [Bradymonadia bacterium]